MTCIRHYCFPRIRQRRAPSRSRSSTRHQPAVCRTESPVRQRKREPVEARYSPTPPAYRWEQRTRPLKTHLLQNCIGREPDHLQVARPLKLCHRHRLHHAPRAVRCGCPDDILTGARSVGGAAHDLLPFRSPRRVLHRPKQQPQHQQLRAEHPPPAAALPTPRPRHHQRSTTHPRHPDGNFGPAECMGVFVDFEVRIPPALEPRSDLRRRIVIH